MQIIDEFLAYEQRITPDVKLRSCQFVKHKSWYVNENYMKKLMAYPMLSTENKIHGIRIRTIWSLAKQFVMRRKARELFPTFSFETAI